MHEIAGYRILRRLGEGGMGAVYLAEAPDGQQVAVKVIRQELLARAEFRERFRREVARAQTVPPFCTAEVIEADPDHEPPYLVIEYVDGPTLFQVVGESGPLRGAKLHSLAVGMATALTAIHGAGVVHRDLKPGNVLFSRGSIKVIDFGIAREIDSDTSGLTTDNQVIGTIPYVSPERLGGAKVLTPAADIFAWGAVVTFAATGRTPFQGDSPADTAVSILSDPPDLDGLDGPLRDLVARTLAKDPAARPAARELLDALLSGSAAPRPTTVELGTTVSVPAGKRRWRKALFAAGASSALAVLVLATFLSGGWKLVTGKASPSASPNTTDVVPSGLRQIIQNGLTNPEEWPDSNDADLGKCIVGPDGLTATLDRASAVYRCNGRYDQTTDFAAYVDVKTVGNACGAIWFRYQLNGSDGPGIQQPDGGYVLQVCGRNAYFNAHNNVYRTLRQFTLPTSVAERASRIGIVARGHEFTFFQDGVLIGDAADDTYRIGRVVLGLFQRNGTKPDAYSATFANLLVFGTSLSNPQ